MAKNHMRALQSFLTTVLGFGLLALVLPLCTFEIQAGSGEKLHAFHAMLISLAGLATISCVLWFRQLIRRRERMKEERISHNAKFLNGLIRKKNSLKAG
jgi:hypothetical protein